MMERRKLIDDGTLVKAYVKFPARLMGKRFGDLNYQEIEDFSNRKVEVKSFTDRN